MTASTSSPDLASTARYLTSDGERVIYAVRVGGMVVVSDWPADGPGRTFVIGAA